MCSTLETIEKYGLSVRQIPKTVRSLYSLRHHKEGNTIVEEECTGWSFEMLHRINGHSPDFRFDHENKRVYRSFSEEIKIPAHAGWWMVQPSTNTSSRMEWNLKTDFLAPTLAGSVALFLESQRKIDNA